MDTIVIDEDSPPINEPDTVIDLDDENNKDVIEICDLDDETDHLDDIYEENALLLKVTEKCLELENSKGMQRVVNRILIPSYRNAASNFKKSVTLEKVLHKTLSQLETDPDHKFSHIKNLCDTLKSFTNENGKKYLLKQKRKTERKKNKFNRKRRRLENIIINLDEDNFEVPVINLDEAVPSICLDSEPLDSPENLDQNIAMENLNQDSVIDVDPESPFMNNADIIEKESEVTPNDVIEIDNSNKENNNNLGKTNTIVSTYHSNSNVSGDMSLLEPTSAVVCNDDINVTERIKGIEYEMHTYKMMIAELEEQEVTCDTTDSPYLQCEYFKSKIVGLYKELCGLTGSDAVKKRRVKLKVTKPELELATKKLQKFINSRIGSDGLPHFPDFNEVVECISKAQEEGSFNWSTHKVMEHARALFTQCGRAIQRNRQKREWRDMKALAHRQVDDDPADHDPELQAKLQMNRTKAIRRERDLLDWYTSISSNSNRGTNINGGILDNDELNYNEEQLRDSRADHNEWNNYDDVRFIANNCNNSYEGTQNLSTLQPRIFHYKLSRNHQRKVALVPVNNYIVTNPSAELTSTTARLIFRKNEEIRNEINSSSQTYVSYRDTSNDDVSIRSNVTQTVPDSSQGQEMFTSEITSDGDPLPDSTECVTSTNGNEMVHSVSERTSNGSVRNEIPTVTSSTETEIVANNNERIDINLETTELASNRDQLNTMPDSSEGDIAQNNNELTMSVSRKTCDDNDRNGLSVVHNPSINKTTDVNNKEIQLNPEKTPVSFDKSKENGVSLVGINNAETNIETNPEASSVVNENSMDDSENVLSQLNCKDSSDVKVISIQIEEFDQMQDENVSISTVKEQQLGNYSNQSTVAANDEINRIPTPDRVNKVNEVLPKEDDQVASNNTGAHIENDIPANGNETDNDIQTRVKIKTERVDDLLKELEEMGSNFTSTVFDIIDPFLIVEISSDSSSDEDENDDKL